MMGILKSIDRVVLKALMAVTITLFFFLTVLIAANVFVRFFPVVSLHWFDEIIELLYAYLVFYGAAALWITHDEIRQEGCYLRDVSNEDCHNENPDQIGQHLL